MAHDLLPMALQAGCACRGGRVWPCLGFLVAASPPSANAASGSGASASGASASVNSGPDQTVVAQMANGSVSAAGVLGMTPAGKHVSAPGDRVVMQVPKGQVPSVLAHLRSDPAVSQCVGGAAGPRRGDA